MFKVVGFRSSVHWVEGEVEVEDTLSSGLAVSFVGRGEGHTFVKVAFQVVLNIIAWHNFRAY